MRSLADENLEPLMAMVREKRGIDLAKYKDRYLRRRISVRLRASGSRNLSHYLKLLHQSPAECQSLIDVLTINTSGFFRNPGCFQVIRDEVLPAVSLMAGLPGRHPPHIWSVGCGRGEEAYSLAMLLAPFPSLSRALRPPILATDIDEAALREASSGYYPARATADLPREILEASFDAGGSRRRVKAGIRRLVSTKRHDVLGDDLPGRFLLVLCRNLLIYLEKDAQEKLMSRLAEALGPGGYLVLGRSEILVGEARGEFTAVSAAERVYRKLDSPGGDAAGRRDAWRAE